MIKRINHILKPAISACLLLAFSHTLSVAQPNVQPKVQPSAQQNVQSNENVDLPHYFDTSQRLERPDLTGLMRIRFLTTVDFPPFNFIDQTGRLSGYNIDLIKAICAELNVEQICQVEAMPWNELVPSLKNQQGEAIIAGLNDNKDLDADLSFTPAYLKFPARFMALKNVTLNEPVAVNLSKFKTGIIQNTMHEKLFQDYFPKAKFVLFENTGALYKALHDKTIDLAFGDGMTFSGYMNSEQSVGCCHFVAGSYTAPQYLTGGMRIAVDKDNPKLLNALDYALKSLERKGKLAELYLRYFPISFY